jgi:hypothetical protein
MLVSNPALIPHQNNLMIPSHPLAVNPQLAAWPVSSESREFQRRVQNYYWHPGDRGLQSHVMACSKGGLAGVIKGRQIQFQAL